MIDAYSFGRITVDGRRFNSDVIIFPDRVDSSWWRRDGHSLSMEDLEAVVQARPQVLVIGQGKPGLMKVDSDLITRLNRLGIEVHAAPTPKAVTLYNALSPEKRVVAALHLTC